jgi:exodeoxyribonuclease-3
VSWADQAGRPTGSPPFKIATFNINNVNKRLPNLLAWLAQAKPDAVCLQALKAESGAFSEPALTAAG